MSDTDSDTAVNEDDRFRLAVPPMARAFKALINDLNEALRKIKQKQPHLKKHRSHESVPIDQSRMGLRFAFREGLGFIDFFDRESTVERE